MIRLYTLCGIAAAFLSIQTLKAQSHFQVEVSNFQYTPENLTIQVGDTVTWTNVQGSHNVNGSTATFPNNSSSFKNAVAGPGWKFTYVFTEAGLHDYHCDPHASFMKGSVFVDAATNITESSTTSLSIYPNPAKAGDAIRLNSTQSTSSKLRVTDLNGKIISSGTATKVEIPMGTSTGSFRISNGTKSAALLIIE